MTEELKQLLTHLAGEEGKHVVADIGEDGNLSHRTILDQEIAPSGYVHHITIVDDTAMTNQYGYHLEAIIVIDQEEHTQLLGSACILNGKIKSSQLNSDEAEMLAKVDWIADND